MNSLDVRDTAKRQQPIPAPADLLATNLNTVRKDVTFRKSMFFSCMAETDAVFWNLELECGLPLLPVKAAVNYYLQHFNLINKQNVRGRMTVTGC